MVSEQFIEDNLPLIRVMVGVLGVALILASPVAWDLVSWALGFILLVTGMRLALIAVRGQ